MSMSRRVRIWKTKINISPTTKKKSYTVRWKVEGIEHSSTFAGSTLADNFRTDLKKAFNAGESFDIESGLPESMQPKTSGESWFDFVQRYVSMKWPEASANARRGLIESLVVVTMALVRHDVGRPDDLTLRLALAAFLTPTVEDLKTPEAGDALRLF